MADLFDYIISYRVLFVFSRYFYTVWSFSEALLRYWGMGGRGGFRTIWLLRTGGLSAFSSSSGVRSKRTYFLTFVVSGPD